MLVTPRAVVERFTDLPVGTIADMYACVKRIAERLCEHFGASSTTISIQDGKDAGQSVPVSERQPNLLGSREPNVVCLDHGCASTSSRRLRR